MVFSVLLTVLTHHFLWVRRCYGTNEVYLGLLFAAFCWIAQAPAIPFPDIAFADLEFADTAPVILGIELNQLLGTLIFILPVLVLGYYLEGRRLTKA